MTSGSLAQASRELNISPSAASRLIALLEAELKLTLFSRSRRRLELTAEGDQFYRQTEHILRGLDEMAVISSDIVHKSKKRLSLVTAPPIAIGLISPTLARMKRGGVEFECTLNVETRFDIESKVAARAYNLGIISLPIENAIIDLAIEPILEARMGVLLHEDHPSAGKADIDIADLENEPLIGLLKGQRWRERLDEVFGLNNIPSRIVLETTSTHVVKHLVRDGLGLAIADRICGRLMPDEPLVLRPLAPERWITYATIHPKGPRSALAEDFVRALRAFVAENSARDPEFGADVRLLS